MAWPDSARHINEAFVPPNISRLDLFRQLATVRNN
jgi:hypothetical protein